MITGGWICLVAPLAGAILITLAGNRLSRTGAGVVATGSVVVGLGLIVAMSRRRLPLDVDRLKTLRG